MLLIGGSSSRLLTLKVAKELGEQASRVEIKKFPDGERYIRIMDDVYGKEAIVIQSMYHNPDEYLFEYLLLVDTLKDLRAKRVISIIPYFAYARQDERFNPGEAISLLSVAKLIESVGTDEVYTIDMHLHRFSEISRLFKIPSFNLSAFPALAEYIQKNLELDNPVVIGPDEEAGQWAKTIAEKLKIEYSVLEKQRLGPDKVEIKPKTLDVEGKDVIIVDDIISTGGTIVEAIRAVKKEGTHKIVVACTHPILVGDALLKIYEAGADIVIGTDTVPSQISYVSVAPTIAKALKDRGG
ncbi:MAG: ribose-phosphate diphosphokinase [Candidatus Bathyarchaeia archaeon]